MNLAGGIFFVGLAGGAIYFFASPRPADVYAMPVDLAYAKLVDVDFGPLSEGEVALDTVKTASGNGRDKVTWVHKGDMAYYKCNLALAPLPDDTAQTHVTVTCDGGGAGNGAAAGMAHNLFRSRIIERVDATLTDRPFDKDRAGATASRWPGDGVDGSLGTASTEALKMNAEMRRMQRESSEAD